MLLKLWDICQYELNLLIFNKYHYKHKVSLYVLHKAMVGLYILLVEIYSPRSFSNQQNCNSAIRIINIQYQVNTSTKSDFFPPKSPMNMFKNFKRPLNFRTGNDLYKILGF